MDDPEAPAILLFFGLLALYILGRRRPRPRSRISRATRYRIWRRDHGVCQYCGEQIPSLSYAHIDHLRPVSRGSPFWDFIDRLRGIR